jgi:PPOX class probable F420-dependent enzyme
MGVMSAPMLEYLKSHELCRLATASRDARPHVVPVIYAVDGEDVIVAVDYGTRKLRNLMENPRAALVVDEYRPGPHGGLFVEGDCEVLERGKEYLRLLQVLFDRFESYRKNPWEEGESPILKLRPTKAVMW